MPTPTEPRRTRHRADQACIRERVAALRAHGEAGDGFAALDRDADATAALMEVIADGGVADARAPGWEHARRVAEAVLHPVGAAGPVGPLPTGYDNPHLARREREEGRLRPR